MLIGTADNTIHQQNPYTNKAENHQTTGAIDKTDNASKVESQKLPGSLIEPHDEYIPTSDKPNETPGIYRLEKDENGNQKIVFDRPASTVKVQQAGTAENTASEDLPKATTNQVKEGEIPKKKSDNPDIVGEIPDIAGAPDKKSDKEVESRCTINTNKVDAEINKLKEEKKQLEKQLKSAGEDKNKLKDLEKQLSQVASELSAKDNEAYRKQNATSTYN